MQTLGSVKRLAGKTSLGWTESGVKRLGEVVYHGLWVLVFYDP